MAITNCHISVAENSTSSAQVPRGREWQQVGEVCGTKIWGQQRCLWKSACIKKIVMHTQCNIIQPKNNGILFCGNMNEPGTHVK
jgi:hypothetical protein